jgi:arylsulfatase A-like enzyme
LPRLERHGKGPLFLFLHLLDAHAPYDSASGASAFERYLGELGLVDQQLARLVALLNARFAGRAALIVTADHGEAFAEHGAYYHATALYEEQIRVPLLISVPGVEPRAVSTPVSLVDLGPTILDLFGLATPGHFMGESLTAFLRGESPTLTRPIAAEVRLMHMLIDPDGYKSIIDDRTHIGEVYDLHRDPGEHRNLNDGGAAPAARLALLDAFFSAHRNQRPGYKLPFRP